MQRTATKSQHLKLESFADVVWAVPLARSAHTHEPAGRLLDRVNGHGARHRRVILLRSYKGDHAPDMFVV